MAGNVINIKVCSPLKLHYGSTGNYHLICHYSYNLPFGHIGFAELGLRPSVQLKLNFCLPVASQLLQPKEMCPNGAAKPNC